MLGSYNMSRGCGHHRHVRYVMMSKVASEDISGNMRAWAHGERTDPANCTFTFVREPLKPSISEQWSGLRDVAAQQKRPARDFEEDRSSLSGRSFRAALGYRRDRRWPGATVDGPGLRRRVSTGHAPRCAALAHVRLQPRAPRPTRSSTRWFPPCAACRARRERARGAVRDSGRRSYRPRRSVGGRAGPSKPLALRAQVDGRLRSARATFPAAVTLRHAA